MARGSDWPRCVREGCAGIQWADGELCLAHVDERDLPRALAGVRPGADIDLRGTTLSDPLLSRLLAALKPRGERYRRIGNARFDGAHFSGYAGFEALRFDGDASFKGALFSGNTGFNGARFNKSALFSGARFSGDAPGFVGSAGFLAAYFSDGAMFDGAQFSMSVLFGGAHFGADAWFDTAHFSKAASFEGVHFDGDARFNWTRFEGAWLGPMMCRGRFDARGVVVQQPLRLEVAAERVTLTGARFAAMTVLGVRFASVDLTDMVTSGPVTVAFRSAPFTYRGGILTEEGLSGPPQARVINLSGVDAANVVLSDVDLSRCVFSGAHHLDQVRLEGRCTFAAAPRGWYRGRALIPIRRWTARKVLAEEAAWRAADQPGRPALARAGWPPPEPYWSASYTHMMVISPAQLAVLYRQLRKALEDRKDTPGAADFYYGEMEARRHDTNTPRGERALLHAYWLLSGYALRASRALGFLAATATITFLLMVSIGLPTTQPSPQITGTLPTPGRQITLNNTTPAPTLTLPWDQRFTATRADQAALAVINSVIFRSPGITLTGPGTWIEIISRIGEPILLGFAAVAARGRVQR